MRSGLRAPADLFFFLFLSPLRVSSLLGFNISDLRLLNFFITCFCPSFFSSCHVAAWFACSCSGRCPCGALRCLIRLCDGCVLWDPADDGSAECACLHLVSSVGRSPFNCGGELSSPMEASTSPSVVGHSTSQTRSAFLVLMPEHIRGNTTSPVTAVIGQHACYALGGGGCCLLEHLQREQSILPAVVSASGIR